MCACLFLYFFLQAFYVPTALADICLQMYIVYLSPEFVDEMGVAQGGILSPYLFKKFLADLACNLSKQWGVVLDELTVLTHLLWADDLVLISDSDYGLQCQLDNLFNYCSKWQMIINNLKNKASCLQQWGHSYAKF